MRFLIALIVILVVVDGYFYNWYYSLQVRDQAMEIVERFRPNGQEQGATGNRS